MRAPPTPHQHAVLSMLAVSPKGIELHPHICKVPDREALKKLGYAYARRIGPNAPFSSRGRWVWFASDKGREFLASNPIPRKED